MFNNADLSDRAETGFDLVGTATFAPSHRGLFPPILRAHF